jgi:hypothetical protein
VALLALVLVVADSTAAAVVVDTPAADVAKQSLNEK